MLLGILVEFPIPSWVELETFSRDNNFRNKKYSNKDQLIGIPINAFSSDLDDNDS